jgi:hypothetical protein
MLSQTAKLNHEMSDINKTIAFLLKTTESEISKKILKMAQTHKISNELSTKIKLFNENLNNSGLYETFRKVGENIRNLENNPELQFGIISDLEILSLKSTEQLNSSLSEDYIDEKISNTENILNRNLLPYLEKLELDSLWLGANYALNSDKNPDKLRHCLISLRTILEYIIDEKLAPKSELMNLEMFKKEFKDYHLGKETIEYVRIKRDKKIEYFTSKIKFGLLDEFAKKDIEFVCSCYTILCNIHQREIGVTENQVRILKVKTGITIWLLAYIYEIINN